MTFLALCTTIPLLINLSQEPWEPHDYNEVKIATDRCVVHYPDAPCLKKFVKVKYHTYRAICGEAP